MFLTDDPVVPQLWGPIIGPIIAVASFVCSIGNVALAAALYGGSTLATLSVLVLVWVAVRRAGRPPGEEVSPMFFDTFVVTVALGSTLATVLR